jgi:oligopeptide transport system ATP-binding protein
MPPILDVRDLVTRFYTIDGIVHAVNGVSFTLDEGETLAIVGESGSGKSVAMMSILGLLPPAQGRVEQGQAIFRGPHGTQDLLQLRARELRDVRGGQVGLVFQDPISTLNPILTIGDQITEVLTRHLSMSQQQARDRALKLLEDVGIPDPQLRYRSFPFQLSGGMRQRVGIAMAIACTPQILIADEPTTALDVTVQAQIAELFKRLREKMGVAIIWITHDLGVVAGLAHRVLVMYAGRVAEIASVDDLYEHPLHPYTLGLLGALPRLDADGSRRLVSIKGTPPDPLLPHTHCPFVWRCTYAFERCWQEIPPLEFVAADHRAACFFDLQEGMPRHA